MDEAQSQAGREANRELRQDGGWAVDIFASLVTMSDKTKLAFERVLGRYRNTFRELAKNDMSDQCEWQIWIDNRGTNPIRCKNNADFVNLVGGRWKLCKEHHIELMSSYNENHRMEESPKWNPIEALKSLVL